ncbi:MAG: sugar phosphate nucleotidyltransferase [Candidatus Hodarchaeota archaeon]
MIRKVVIPAAGLGTRLLPITKEQPKEMLPIFIRTIKGKIILKPVLHVIFEGLYDFGFREFCFIVGRGKRAIEDYFTPDDSFVSFLKYKKHNEQANELERFYEKIIGSNILFSNQPRPFGFGDAVLRAESFVRNESFLVHAGDDLILSKNKRYLKRLIKSSEELDSDALFLVEEVDNPKNYGVIIGDEIDEGLYKVKKIVEKPKIPPSNLAVVAIYVFNSNIIKSLKKTNVDEKGELQLTNAIQNLIYDDFSVYALKLNSNDTRVEIGTANNYLNAIGKTINYLT